MRATTEGAVPGFGLFSCCAAAAATTADSSAATTADADATTSGSSCCFCAAAETATTAAASAANLQLHDLAPGRAFGPQGPVLRFINIPSVYKGTLP